MLRRGVCFSIVSALLFSAAAPASAAQPLKPFEPWVVHYDPSTCTAERAYGDKKDTTFLALEPSAWGDTYDLLVATQGWGPRLTEEMSGSVDFGHGINKAWLLHYGTDKPSKLDFYRFRISAEEMAQAASAPTVTFHLDRHQDFTFSLEQMPDLLKTLAACTTDLQHYWNMIDPEQKKIAAPAIGDVRQIFSPTDYPQEAMSRRQEGRVQFLLLIDEQGKVAKCTVLHPSGIPALDGMGCQVISQRARFKPALDHDGKPIRSTVTTPPVVWKIAGR